MHLKMIRNMVVGSIGLLACISAVGQAIPRAATVSGEDNQMYVGFEHTRYDYELLTSQGNQVLTTSGVNIQYNYRSRSHVVLTGTMRYGSGPLEGQSMTTIGVGAGLVGNIWRAEPFAQVLGGIARLSSTDNIYLSNSATSSFTTMLGAGVDIPVTGHWGIRPIYIENQFLSFGERRSIYLNLGAGILYRFHSKLDGPHKKNY
ncbi:MAG TPA: hypothetical protein VIX90_09045 [Edaphobacter sp.]